MTSRIDNDELRRLRAIRERCPTILRFLEELLAAQGDAADRALITLQHDLAELLQPPASQPSEQNYTNQ